MQVRPSDRKAPLMSSPRSIRLPVVVFGTVCLASLPLVAWIPQAATTIAGRVVDGVTMLPVAGATVEVSVLDRGGARLSRQSIESDAEGQFRAAVDSRGSLLRLSASRPGYVQSYAGNLGPADVVGFGRTYDLPPRLGDRPIRIVTWPTATIHGTISDGSGRPIPGARVDALTGVYTGLGWRWSTRPAAAHRTDDRGDFRIEGLKPGRYVIAVRLPSGGSAMPMFFPGPGEPAEAQFLTIASGESHRLDVRPDLSRSHAPLSGRVVGGMSPGEHSIELTAVDRLGESLGFSKIVVQSGPGGRFRVDRVPPGRYRFGTVRFPPSVVPLFTWGGDFTRTIRSTGSPDGQPVANALPDAPTWVGSAIVEHPSSTEIEVALREGRRISGRIEVKTAESVDRLRGMPIIVRPADGTDLGPIPQGRVGVDLSFRSIGLPDGNYVIGSVPEVAALTGLKITSVRSGGNELIGGALMLADSDLPDVVVTMSADTTVISGTVAISGADSDTLPRVVIFPKDPTRWNRHMAPPSEQLVRQVFVDSALTFRTELPPGEYLVAALSRIELDWMTPDRLRSIAPSAATVAVKSGQTATVRIAAR